MPRNRAFLKTEDAWVKMPPRVMEDVYKLPLIDEVYRAERRLIRKFLDEDCVLLEVGCGTGRFCKSFQGQVRRVVGNDISADFLADIQGEARKLREDLVLIKGNAVKLMNLLKKEPRLTEDLRSRRWVVCCVMNTLGVMEAKIRRPVVSQMIEACGGNGTFFLAVFNKEHFSRGVSELYRPNPDLLGGELKEKDISWDTAEIQVGNYSSHWFSKREVEALVEEAGLRNYRILEGPGVGIYVLATLG